MLIKNRLTLAVSAALGLGTAALLPAVANAQDEQLIEEVVITGSRIARTGTDTPTPMTAVDSEALKVQNNVNLGETLLRLPQTGIPGSNNNNSNFQSNATGLTTVDLRNLGPQRTLILVNGRRHVGGDSENPSAVDLNSIPQAFVERIEVITGGASAVYGSDAMAGVINIITKTDFEGLEVNMRHGQSDESDGDNDQLDITFGAQFDEGRGYALANFSYTETDEIFARDRGISDQCLDGDGKRDNQCYSSFAPQGSVFSPLGRLLTQFDDGSWGKPFVGSEDGFDRTTDSRLLQVPLEQRSFAFNARYALNDYVNVFGEASYIETESKSNLEPSITGLFISVGSEDLVLPGDNPFIPQGIIDEFAAEGVNLPDADYDVTFLKRFKELGPRIQEPTRETARYVFGLDGDVDNWHWEAYYQYGSNDQTQKSEGDFNTFFFQQGLNVESDGAGGYQCKDALARSLGCAPIDLFGLGSISEEALNFVRATAVNTQKIEQEVAAFTLSGSAFELPGGAIGMAGGVEWREESLDIRTDALRRAGLSSSNQQSPVSGSYDVTEAFVEVSAPVLESVVVDAAFRWADYSTVGSVSSWKFGGSWDIADFRLRATLSEANRAPNVAELFDPGSQTFESFADPCSGGGAAGTVRTNCASQGVPIGWDPGPNGQSAGGTQAGNPNLTEESADTWTAGIVYTPSWLDNASLTLDWWDIEIEDAIELIDPQIKLNNCYSAGNFPNNEFCSGITRAGQNINYVIKELNFGLENIGVLETAGMDIEFNYAMDTSVGFWNLQVLGVYTDKWERQIFDAVDDQLEEPGFQEWKWNSNVSWSTGPWSVSWSTRYLGEGTVDQNLEGFIADNTTDAVWYHDLYGAYNLELDNMNVEFYVGGKNVTDEDAPYVPADSANETIGTATAAGVYDVIGPFYYFGVRANF